LPESSPVSLIKTITRNEIVRRVLCRLGAGYIRFVYASSRWQTIRGDIPKKFFDQDKPFILSFWHGRLLMMPYCWDKTKPIYMLASSHPDGQLIAKTVVNFGIKTIAGSTTRGGTAALRGLLGIIKAGECIGLTPDGPRGPRMRVSDGIVNIARLAGVPIIPASFGITRRRVLGSWDRFVLAKPFSRGVIVWGEPITIDRDADDDAQETARRAVEEGLNAVTNEADTLCGCTTIEPAPLIEQGAS
jgi:lysophospholipid acyltransferase (LPLAT)-like uncharacterized protein